MSPGASKRPRQAPPPAASSSCGSMAAVQSGGVRCCGKNGSGGVGGGADAGCCNRCFKRCLVCTATMTRLCLIIPNIVFLLFGGTLIGLGVWMRADRESSFYLEVLRSVPASPLITFDKVPVVIIIVGSCVAILSFLGCCGACAESVCFLCLYMLLLIAVLVTELVLGIVAVAMQDQIRLKLETIMQQQIKYEYNATDQPRSSDNRTTYSHHFTEAWNTMQTEFNCCGAVGPEDYLDSAWNNRTKSTDKRRVPLVPLSCCYQTTTDQKKPGYKGPPALDKKGDDCPLEASMFFTNPDLWRKKGSSTALKTQGCRESMVQLIQQNLSIVVGVVSSVAMLQIADFVFACVLMRYVRKKQETWYNDADDYANDDRAE